MKKLYYGAAAAVLPIFAGALPAFAQDDATDLLDRVNTTAELSGAELPELIGSFIYTLLGFLGIVFLVIVIYSGFLWMTAGGDPDKVKKAQSRLMQAVVGLVIILAAYAITSFVMTAIIEAGLNA